MSRLTYKENWYDEFGNKHSYHSEDNYCIEKLGQYEDLEEELGIDLPILFKAKKVYFKYNEEDINIKKSYKVCFDITNSCLIAYEGIFDDFGTWLELKDYKKTWALRKEVLE